MEKRDILSSFKTTSKLIRTLAPSVDRPAFYRKASALHSNNDCIDGDCTLSCVAKNTQFRERFLVVNGK